VVPVCFLSEIHEKKKNEKSVILFYGLFDLFTICIYKNLIFKDERRERREP
jgi:hypothetical protein